MKKVIFVLLVLFAGMGAMRAGEDVVELFKAKYLGVESLCILEHVDQPLGETNHKRILLEKGKIGVNDKNGDVRVLIGTMERPQDGKTVGAIIFICPDGSKKAITLDPENNIAIHN